jgi:RNA polymerase sigma factor (sigma-70 family)
VVLARRRPIESQPLLRAADAANAPDPLGDWVRRHQRAPWRLLRLFGCPAHLADDLVQEALLAAVQKQIDRAPDDEAAAWLRGAVRNLWRMHLRAQRRRPPHVDLDVDLHLAEQALSRNGADDGGDAFVDALRRCLEQLDGRARTALDLRYKDDAPRAAMAQALALTDDGVKTLLRRTRAVLLACVQRRVRTAKENR